LTVGRLKANAMENGVLRGWTGIWMGQEFHLSVEAIYTNMRQQCHENPNHGE
jgi:hypothetical protein